MTSLAAIAVLMLSGATPPPALKLAAPQLTLRNIDEASGAYYLEQLAQAFAERGASVITSKDIQQVIGLERQKALAGCASDQCLMELSAALGVDALLTGSIGKIERRYQLVVKVLNARTGVALASYSARVDDEGRLLDAMGEAADRMVPEVAAALRRQLGPGAKAVRAPGAAGPGPHLAWLPLGGGLVLAATGAGLLLGAKADHDALRDPTVSLSESEGMLRRDRGSVLQISGFACAGAGALAVGAGLLWPLLAPPRTSAAVVPLREGGAVVSFSGELP